MHKQKKIDLLFEAKYLSKNTWTKPTRVKHMPEPNNLTHKGKYTSKSN